MLVVPSRQSGASGLCSSGLTISLHCTVGVCVHLICALSVCVIKCSWSLSGVLGKRAKVCVHSSQCANHIEAESDQRPSVRSAAVEKQRRAPSTNSPIIVPHRSSAFLIVPYAAGSPFGRSSEFRSLSEWSASLFNLLLAIFFHRRRRFVNLKSEE